MILWVKLIAVLAPMVFFAGMIFVNGLFGLAMCVLGKLTWVQFIDFSWPEKCPASWYSAHIT